MRSLFDLEYWRTICQGLPLSVRLDQLPYKDFHLFFCDVMSEGRKVEGSGVGGWEGRGGGGKARRGYVSVCKVLEGELSGIFKDSGGLGNWADVDCSKAEEPAACKSAKAVSSFGLFLFEPAWNERVSLSFFPGGLSRVTPFWRLSEIIQTFYCLPTFSTNNLSFWEWFSHFCSFVWIFKKENLKKNIYCKLINIKQHSPGMYTIWQNKTTNKMNKTMNNNK